jgi:hypothetical protein
LALSENIDARSFFTLYKTPDGAFVIYSDHHPDHAIAIESWWGCGNADEANKNHFPIEEEEELAKQMQHGDDDDDDDDDKKGHAKQTNGCKKEIFWDAILPNVKKEWRTSGEGPDPDKFEPSAPTVALTITAPPRGYDDEKRAKAYRFNGTYPVMLQSHMFSNRFMYVDFYGEPGDFPKIAHMDPGDGGLWVFDPPLPMELIFGDQGAIVEFNGDRCAHNCHGANNIGQMSSAAYYVIWVMFAIGLLICAAFLVLAFFMPQYNFL